jgi:hypothetical protein
VTRVLFGFALGVACLGWTVSLRKPPSLPAQTAVAPAAPGPAEKEIVRREIQLRFYAPDGTYMLATDTEYIDSSVGDTITSNSWKAVSD